MRNYIKPSAEVVELAVKESVSALSQPTAKKRDFGFGSKKKAISLTQYSTLFASVQNNATTQG